MSMLLPAIAAMTCGPPPTVANSVLTLGPNALANAPDALPNVCGLAEPKWPEHGGRLLREDVARGAASRRRQASTTPMLSHELERVAYGTAWYGHLVLPSKFDMSDSRSSFAASFLVPTRDVEPLRRKALARA